MKLLLLLLLLSHQRPGILQASVTTASSTCDAATQQDTHNNTNSTRAACHKGQQSSGGDLVTTASQRPVCVLRLDCLTAVGCLCLLQLRYAPAYSLLPLLAPRLLPGLVHLLLPACCPATCCSRRAFLHTSCKQQREQQHCSDVIAYRNHSTLNTRTTTLNTLNLPTTNSSTSMGGEG